jgi:hypothetical protein
VTGSKSFWWWRRLWSRKWRESWKRDREEEEVVLAAVQEVLSESKEKVHRGGGGKCGEGAGVGGAVAEGRRCVEVWF